MFDSVMDNAINFIENYFYFSFPTLTFFLNVLFVLVIWTLICCSQVYEQKSVKRNLRLIKRVVSTSPPHIFHVISFLVVNMVNHPWTVSISRCPLQRSWPEMFLSEFVSFWWTGQLSAFSGKKKKKKRHFKKLHHQQLTCFLKECINCSYSMFTFREKFVFDLSYSPQFWK